MAMTDMRFFNLAGPPRSVPLLVRTKVLLGGFLTQFGCIFLGFGMIFVWAFTLNADLTSWYHFRGRLETAQGTVLHSEQTSFSVGGSEHSKGTPIYANHYSFVGPGNVEYEGVSYKKGRALKKGGKVTVEYPPDQPERSRINGMRRSPMGLFGLMPIIFPLVGLCLMTVGLKKGIRGNRLLVIGHQTTGKLKSKVATSTKINNRTVFKLTFEFTAADGIGYEAVGKTHKPEKLEDEAEEPLLYDPILPSYAVMLDALPDSAAGVRLARVETPTRWQDEREIDLDGAAVGDLRQRDLKC
jgi:hypothetical protein